MSSSGRVSSLVTESGAIAADVALARDTLTTVITTASLGVGTWLVSAGVTVAVAAAGESIDVEMVAGTATATLTGHTSTVVGYQAFVGSASYKCAELSAVVVVTVAGTIIIRCEMAGAATACTAKATTVEGFANATGYTAVKVA